MPTRLTLQRYRNEASAAKYEMNAVLKEMKRHRKESERVQLQQQLSIRSLKEQLSMAQQALQEQVGSGTVIADHVQLVQVTRFDADYIKQVVVSGLPHMPQVLP